MPTLVKDMASLALEHMEIMDRIESGRTVAAELRPILSCVPGLGEPAGHTVALISGVLAVMPKRETVTCAE